MDLARPIKFSACSNAQYLKVEELQLVHLGPSQVQYLSSMVCLTVPAKKTSPSEGTSLGNDIIWYSLCLTFPSIASFAHLASSSLEKMTNPKPLDLPLSLSYTILTTRKGLQ